MVVRTNISSGSVPKKCVWKRVFRYTKSDMEIFSATRRGVLFIFLCYSLHSGNNSRSRSIRGTGLR